MSLPNKPDNQRLIHLLNAWAQDRSRETYTAVRNELQEGNSFLMLPSAKGQAMVAGWHTTTEPTKLGLASLYTIDGIKVLGAFTDPDSVLRWSKGKVTWCSSLQSQAVLELCERNAIKKIIINGGSENVFPLSYYFNDELGQDQEYW
jgi:hypothetical protein